MGLVLDRQTHGVDLIMNWPPVAAPFPARAVRRSSRRPGLPCIPPRLPARIGGDGAGLAQLPNDVVTWTAGPGVGPGPFATRPSPPGACSTCCGPVAPRAQWAASARVEINSTPLGRGRARDR